MICLVACEESQAITKELRALGHEAFSCDLQECSGGHPEWHIEGCALEEAYSGKYDLMIAHPPCTYLCVSGARWFYNEDGTPNQERHKQRTEALKFVRMLMAAPIVRIAIENPVGAIGSHIKKPDQIVQPWQFGDEYQKTTCWWLKNLPLLKPTKIVSKGEFLEWTTEQGEKKRMTKWYSEASGKNAGKIRSKTFPGMAAAIAKQWTVEDHPIQMSLFFKS